MTTRVVRRRPRAAQNPYSKIVGVYLLPGGTDGYRRLCDPHAVDRGMGDVARTGVAAALAHEDCEDCTEARGRAE